MPAQHTYDFVKYAPFMAILIAIGVALMQYYLQRQQQKQNLYEKRWQVYRSVSTYWRNLVESNGQPPIEARQRFLADLSHATFLFGREVVKFLERYYAVTEEYCKASERLRIRTAGQGSGLVSAANERDVATKEMELLAGITKAEVFGPYLQIYQEGSWLLRLFRRINRWVNQEQPDTLASRYDA
jgi:hypothetical protein